MVVFRPFRGWRYNPDVVGSLDSVLCPPYDLIAPELKRSLGRLSPYNAVHLEGGERPDRDTPDNSYYHKAATAFEEWRRQGVLLREPEPSFYLLRHGFKFQGQAKARLGLFGCVRLETYERRMVLPHEYTKDPAIQDRVSLMEACNANFSPILSLYRDAAGLLAPVFDQTMAGSPALETLDGPEVSLTLWRIADPGPQEQIGKFFAERAVYLADGHHRYEAALKFREVKLARANGPASPDAAFNFVMMALTEFDDPGLVVLPYHRVLGGLPAPALTLLKERLHQLFEVTAVTVPPERSAEVLLEQVAHHGQDRQVVGLVGPEGEGPRLLTLRDGVGWSGWGPLAVSEAWILEDQVLKPVLGPRLSEYLSYVHDHGLAVAQVNSGQQQMAFLLNPLSMTQFEALVGGGFRLPPKSTFFHPKLPTGLLFNQLNGNLQSV